MAINRQEVYEKCDGHCAYCGKTIAIKEMQVDHVVPKWLLSERKATLGLYEEIHADSNLMPACRRCNHYKRGDSLEGFRDKVKTLHERVCSHYIGKVALDYGIVKLEPFDGIFYFEKLCFS